MFNIEGTEGAAVTAKALTIHTVADDSNFQCCSAFLTPLLLAIPALVLQVTPAKPVLNNHLYGRHCALIQMCIDPFIYSSQVSTMHQTILCRPWEYSSKQSRNPCPHGAYLLVGKVDHKTNKVLLYLISTDKCYEEK